MTAKQRVKCCSRFRSFNDAGDPVTPELDCLRRKLKQDMEDTDKWWVLGKPCWFYLLRWELFCWLLPWKHTVPESRVDTAASGDSKVVTAQLHSRLQAEKEAIT